MTQIHQDKNSCSKCGQRLHNPIPTRLQLEQELGALLGMPSNRKNVYGRPIYDMTSKAALQDIIARVKKLKAGK